MAPITIVQPRTFLVGLICIPLAGFVYICIGPLIATDTAAILALVGILTVGALLTWLQLTKGYRKVELNPTQGTVTVEGMSLGFKREIRTYPLSMFQSVYSYVSRFSDRPYYFLVLYSFDKRELLLATHGDVLYGETLLSGPLDSSALAALRKEIAEKCAFKDAGFFNRPLHPAVWIDS